MSQRNISSIYLSIGISHKIFLFIFILMFSIGFIGGKFITLNKGEIYKKYLKPEIKIKQNVTEDDNEIKLLEIIDNRVIENKVIKNKLITISNQNPDTDTTKRDSKTDKQVVFVKKKINRNQPKWKTNALLFKPKPDIPMIAIIIDDMGLDVIRSNRILEIDTPLTTSYMTYAVNLKNQIQNAKNAGKEIMLHVPMEAKSEVYDEGPDVLKTSYDTKLLQTIIRQQLGKSDEIVGINNHMGSKFTEDFASMNAILQIVKGAGLIFVDSKTSQKSIGAKVAKIIEMPHLTRDIFLDHYPEEKEIEQQLKMLESFAKRKGYAVAIGHPRDNTINVLKKWIPDVQNRGFQIVPITTIIKHINNL